MNIEQRKQLIAALKVRATSFDPEITPLPSIADYANIHNYQFQVLAKLEAELYDECRIQVEVTGTKVYKKDVTQEDYLSVVREVIEGYRNSTPLEFMFENEDYIVTNKQGFFVMLRSGSDDHRSPTGDKLHISLDDTDPDNMDRGWRLVASLAKKHQLTDFKVFNYPTPDDKKGRQVAIYCNEGKSIPPEFMEELEEQLLAQHIKPDPRGMPDDCKRIGHSPYMSFRNDTFDFGEQPSYLVDEGAPEHYLSQDHIETAKLLLQQDETARIVDHLPSSVRSQTAEVQQRFIQNVDKLVQFVRSEAKMRREPCWHDLQRSSPLNDTMLHPEQRRDRMAAERLRHLEIRYDITHAQRKDMIIEHQILTENRYDEARRQQGSVQRSEAEADPSPSVTPKK